MSAVETPHSAVAITPSDSTDIPVTRAIYVGGAGAVAVLMHDGTAVTLTGMLAGNIYQLRIRRVKATGTTATSLIALY